MLRALMVILLLAGATAGRAELAMEVKRGYTFQEGERVTTNALKLLGKPKMTVSGTLSGSSVLGTNSITGTLLMDSVAGNYPYGTLSWNGQHNLTVAAGGVSTNEASTNLWGSGLAMDAQKRVVVPYDTNRITTSAGTVVVGVTRPKFMVREYNKFFYEYYPLGQSNLFRTAHGLNQKPRFVRWYLRCLQANHGYAVDDEITICESAGANNNSATITAMADATYVELRVAYGLRGEFLEIINRTNYLGMDIILPTIEWALWVQAR
jgi:hypothetical protein